jgi:gluconolactonase
MSEQDCVLWSDIPNNRILRWSEIDGMTVWRDKVEFTNGHTRDLNGDLLHCSHGLRAIVRTPMLDAKVSADTACELVVSHYQGKRLNSPNDLVVKRDGTVWFTDPPYGILSDREGHTAASEQTGNFVYCYNPASGELRLASDYLVEPNGLAFSPDERHLYVSDTSAALRTDGTGNHHIVRFNVKTNNTLHSPSVFAVVSPGLSDGFRIDTQGWVYSSSEDSVQIFHSDGTLLGKISVPEKVGNLTFGGVGRNQLYIAASTSLYRITLNTQGNQSP